jgi:hypothetical protein
MYKPFSGAGIRRFEAELGNELPPQWQETLLVHQIEINKETFSWLFPEAPGAQLQLSSRCTTTRHESQDLVSRGPNGSPSPQSSQLLRGIEQLSLTSIERDYIIPERDYFIWLLDRDPYDGDLLIVRIDREGSILRPLVVFDSEKSDWEWRDFRNVITEERERIPDVMLTDFRVPQDGGSYIKNCVARSPRYFREPQTQFCAIIPLGQRAYDRQRGPDSLEDTAFGRLESFLGLPRLIRDAEKANEQWCKCKAPFNKYSPSMILCDNMQCPLGWYHKKCVDLDEDFTADHWLCNQCLRKFQGVELCQVKGQEIDEEIREESDVRIQRAKTLARVWEAHNWPSAERVRHLVDRISSRINIRTTAKNTYDTSSGLNIKDSDESRCWAIVRDIPKVMMAVRPVGRDMVRRTNQSARRITHRKSDYGISSARTARSLT